jgi:hypoxanthine phosphoribosyltransferase
VSNANIHKTILNWSDVEKLVNQIVAQIKESNWHPDIVIALSRGGFVPATMIAYKLKIKHLAGLDTRKNNEGIRSTGYIVSLQDFSNQKVLVVDDGIITGHLLKIVLEEVRTKGGEPRTCALISEGQCQDPDYLIETRDQIPIFPWE